MIPRINNRGHSFKGVTDYLMHDKKADSAERVEWTYTGNMYTNDVYKASKIMAWTDINSDQLKRDTGGSRAGRKAETGSVYHYSLSWAQGESPEQEHQKLMADATLERLGLSDHQFYYVAHNDTKHNHLHIVVNLTHHETGKRAELPLDKNKLQAWALEYEREHGMYCLLREENAIKRGQGEQTKYRGQKKEYATQVTRAYYASDSGQAFRNAIEKEGLFLAKGNRNALVIVDSKGSIQRLMRQLETDERGQAKTKAVLSKLKDLDLENLPEANQLSIAVKEQNSLYDREAAEVEKQKKLEDSAYKNAADKVRLEDVIARNKDSQKIAREQKANRLEKKRIADLFQRKIDKKTAESYSKWEIEKLEKSKEKATKELENLSGVGSRLFKRKDFEQAYENLENLKLQLEERRFRFFTDIEAFNKKRPQWAINREYEKHGVSDLAGLSDESKQDRLDIKAKEKPIINENEINLENANHLEGKTDSERRKISKIKLLATEFKAKIVADKEAIEQKEINEEEKQERKKEEEYIIRSKQEELGSIPEFDSEEAERIWRELREIEAQKKRERDNDIGLER